MEKARDGYTNIMKRENKDVNKTTKLKDYLKPIILYLSKTLIILKYNTL